MAHARESSKDFKGILLTGMRGVLGPRRYGRRNILAQLGGLSSVLHVTVTPTCNDATHKHCHKQ